MTEERSDVSRLVREIQGAAADRRASGDIPGDLEHSVEEAFRKFVPRDRLPHRAGGMDEVIRDLERRSHLDADVSTASESAVLVPVKRSVKAAVGWYIGALAGQIRDFMGSCVRALNVTRDVVDAVEDRIDELQAQVDELQRRLDARDT